MRKDQGILRGSWGNITFDRKTGAVLHWDGEGDEGCDAGYADIVRVDVDTLLACPCYQEHRETDILGAGYWLRAGTYVKALRYDHMVGRWCE